ncbi:MAG: hypothetical protein ACI9QD_000263 [Thermoproteota archaeon]|jgi:hypothetical protein
MIKEITLSKNHECNIYGPVIFFIISKNDTIAFSVCRKLVSVNIYFINTRFILLSIKN